jgi:hypothetical protein
MIAARGSRLADDTAKPTDEDFLPAETEIFRQPTSGSMNRARRHRRRGAMENGHRPPRATNEFITSR